MLRLVKINKQDYDVLPADKKQLKETMFLVKDIFTNRCSIYIDDVCYGEDIDEDQINTRIDDIEKNLSLYAMANNYDILDIINS